MTANVGLFLLAFGFAILGLLLMWGIAQWSRPPAGRQLSRETLVDVHGNPEPDLYRELADRIRSYTTPPDRSKCRNLVKDGPTPCWHPHCDCMTTDYAEPRPRLGADEVLRRHLYATQKAKHERSRPKA